MQAFPGEASDPRLGTIMRVQSNQGYNHEGNRSLTELPQLRDIRKKLPLRVLSAADWEHWTTQGYVIVPDAAPAENIERLKAVLWEFQELNPNDPSSWNRPQMRDHRMPELNNTGMVEMFNHQCLWDNRQQRRIYDAFVETGLELEHQLSEAGVVGPVHFWGLTGRSIAGLRLYAKNRGLPWSATAVMYSPGSTNDFTKVTVDRSQKVAETLNMPEHLSSNDLTVLTAYTGPAYGVPFDGVFEAMHMTAKSESIILDPNYTGKSMAALIAEIRAGRVEPDVPVVFIHSGGMPQVFAFAQEIWDWNGQAD